MRRKSLFFIVFLCVLVFSSFLVIPAVATVIFFSNIPLTDAADDVQRFPGTATTGGVTGDYHDEIDMLQIAIVGNNLTITFAAPYQDIVNYTINIQLDNNSDDILEYLIEGVGNAFTLTRSMGLQYWDSACVGWYSSPRSLSYAKSGNDLVLIDVKIAIPELTNCRVMAATNYNGSLMAYNYIDYAPAQQPSSGGIPSFALLCTLYSLLVLMGLAFITRKDKSLF